MSLRDNHVRSDAPPCRQRCMAAASPLRSFLTPATLGTSWPGGAALDLLETAGVRTSQHQLAQVGNRSILILWRFDRACDGVRIGYISAMTATGSSDDERKGYADLVETIRDLLLARARPPSCKTSMSSMSESSRASLSVTPGS